MLKIAHESPGFRFEYCCVRECSVTVQCHYSSEHTLSPEVSDQQGIQSANKFQCGHESCNQC